MVGEAGGFVPHIGRCSGGKNISRAVPSRLGNTALLLLECDLHEAVCRPQTSIVTPSAFRSNQLLR